MASSALTKKIIYFIQDFQPFIHFCTNILIETKDFQLNEVTNKIIPIFFYASVLSIIFTFWLIEYISESVSLIFVSICPVFVITIFTFMGPRRLFIAQMCYALTGANQAFKTILRTLLVTNRKGADLAMTKIKFTKYLSVCISGWIGQSIYYQTHSYDINCYISILTTLIAAVLSVLSQDIKDKPIESGLLKNVNSFSEFLDKLSEIYHRDLLMAVICGSMTACMMIYLSMYGTAIFHEKHQSSSSETKTNSLLNRIFLIIHLPIQYISILIVKIFSIFISEKKTEISSIKTSNVSMGYIEGTTKLIGTLTSSFIISCIPEEFKQNAYIIFFIFSILFLTLMQSISSLSMLKLMYFISFSFIMTAENLAKSFIHASEYKTFVFCACLLCESILHSIIGSICRYYGLKTTYKAYFYIVLACICLSVVLYLKMLS